MFHKANVDFSEHIRTYIAQELAISQVAEQKRKQMRQYVQILAPFVAFIFFLGSFYDFAKDFLAI